MAVLDLEDTPEEELAVFVFSVLEAGTRRASLLFRVEGVFGLMDCSGTSRRFIAN